MERKTQKRLIKYLKDKGCYVIKTKPGPGTPVGCPDVFAFYEGWWGAFEVKSSAKAPFKPLQKETLEKLAGWSTVWVVHPGNIDAVISQLEKVL
jgi:Holliday junction resolvase